MTWLQWAEALSYIVTVFGLPLAILVFLYEQRRERRNEQEEIYQRLSDEYTGFLKLVLGNPDLQLLRKGAPDQPLSDEQNERKLKSSTSHLPFERAYLAFEERWIGRRNLWPPGKTTCASGVAEGISVMPCRSCFKVRTRNSARTSRRSPTPKRQGQRVGRRQEADGGPDGKRQAKPGPAGTVERA